MAKKHHLKITNTSIVYLTLTMHINITIDLFKICFPQVDNLGTDVCFGTLAVVS